MSVSPASRRGRRALSVLTLLLLCLLAGAGCAARGRSAAVPTATPTAMPAPVRFLAVPTFTPTPRADTTYTHLHTYGPAGGLYFQHPGRPRSSGAAEPGGGVVHRRGAQPLPIQGRCHAAVLPHEHHARALVGLYQ